MSKKNIVAGIIVLVVISVSFLIFSFNSAVPSNNISLLSLNITLPNGWYVHRMTSDNDLLLTKQKDLPSIGATERWAYGEQIGIGIIRMDKPLEEWVQTYAGDDVMISSKTWDMLNGHKVLKVEQEAAGAGGKVLNYYFFSGNIAYNFYLYPLEITDSAEKTVRNTVGIEALNQTLQDYGERI